MTPRNEKKPEAGFTTIPGSRLGDKTLGILNILTKGTPRNRLDLEMMLSFAATNPLSRLLAAGYVRKATWGHTTGCYEITHLGRHALGEAITLPTPAYAPVINATMREPYIPAVHNVSRIGVARA